MQTIKLQAVFEPNEELRQRFFNRVAKIPNSCWIWQKAFNPNGYGAFKFDGKKHDAHVFSWRLANGGKPVPLGKLIKHSCDCRPCVNPDHLQLGTSAENRVESIARQGVEPGNAKLTPENVLKIRHRHSLGETTAQLAREFSVSHRTIRDAVHLRTWRHVK